MAGGVLTDVLGPHAGEFLSNCPWGVHHSARLDRAAVFGYLFEDLGANSGTVFRWWHKKDAVAHLTRGKVLDCRILCSQGPEDKVSYFV